MNARNSIHTFIGIAFIFFTLVIGGCQLSKRGPSQTITDVNIYEGSDGLSMEFLENAPPDELYEGDALKIMLRLDNKGAADISNGYLSVALEKDYMELRDFESLRQFRLKGKSIQIPKGDQRVEEFSIRTKELEPQSETHTSTIMVTACYGYATLFAPTVCVDTDKYKENPVKKACEVSDISASDQGAPVAITSVEEKILPRENNGVTPTFVIRISNSGNGEIIDKYKIKEGCSSGSLERESWNYVYVDAFLGDEQLKCWPENKDEKGTKTGYVKLRDKEGDARCVLEDGISTRYASYTTTLKVYLTYGYTFTLSKDVMIKKVSYIRE